MKTILTDRSLKTARCVIAGLFTMAANTALAANAPESVAKTLITNAHIFDGEHEKLTEAMSVLVEGNKISKIAPSIAAPADATVINANGKVIMPGLIDARWHTMFNFWPMSKILAANFGYLNIAAAKASQDTLLCGPRDPYPGELGVVKEGALADLILVDGNPLENIDLVADAEKNFVLIMKDGKIHKNTVK